LTSILSPLGHTQVAATLQDYLSYAKSVRCVTKGEKLPKLRVFMASIRNRVTGEDVTFPDITFSSEFGTGYNSSKDADNKDCVDEAEDIMDDHHSPVVTTTLKSATSTETTSISSTTSNIITLHTSNGESWESLAGTVNVLNNQGELQHH